MLEPPLAGLTNNGQPSSAMSSRTRLASTVPAAAASSAGVNPGQSRAVTTTYGPSGRPLAAKTRFMYSLSMLTALASTPAPTYGTPASSSRPWMVPSSPQGPCRIGSTTSTSPSRCGICAGALATMLALAARSEPAHGTTCEPGSAIASTEGSWPSVTASRSGASATWTQLPSVVMPIGMTSYRERSMDLSMLPPPMQDTACSGPLPPKTTATLILRCSLTTSSSPRLPRPHLPVPPRFPVRSLPGAPAP